MTYDLPEAGIVTVTAGQGERGVFGDADYVALQIRAVVVGDIGGGSGAPETAVSTNFSTGGTGQFSDVHVYTCTGGVPTRITSAGTGDRAFDGVRTMSIEAGRLFIDRNTDAEGACCPTAAIRQAFVLSGSSLAPTGPAAKRKIMSLNTAVAVPEVTIVFLPGTTGAILLGETTAVRPGGFDAAGGQRVKVTVVPSPAGTSPVAIDLVQDGAVLATATASSATNVVLPATGHYQLSVHTVVVGAPATSFEAELTITS